MLRIFGGNLERTETGNEGREGASTIPQLALHFDISLAAGERQSHAASNKQLAYQMVTAVRLKFCLLNGLDCITSLLPFATCCIFCSS